MKNKYWIIMVGTKPLTNDSKLPIYWYKKIAQKVADKYEGAIVKPITIKL